MSDADADLDSILNLFGVLTISTQSDNIDPNALNQVIAAAVNAALAAKKQDFIGKMNKLCEQFDSVWAIPKPKVYEPIKENRPVPCQESLDAVKCLAQFYGDQEEYVSWRQSAVAAYELYKDFVGSSQHYIAVVIIRNKVKSRANAKLSHFNTPLIFEAIIDRLDPTYADKRSLGVLEQELSVLFHCRVL